MRKWLIPLIILVGMLSAAYYFSPAPTPSIPPPEKPPSLDPEKTEQEIDDSVRLYVRKEFARIDDLSISIVPVLKGLPGVATVTVAGAEKPAKRIIQIAEWHFVPKDDYRIDMEQARGRKLTDAEFDAMYRDLLLEVECAQIEQMGLIKCMRHHGLNTVYSEGYSRGEEKAFAQKVEALIGINKQMGQLRGQLAEVRQIKKKEAAAVEKEIRDAIAGLKPTLLEAGAPTRLLSQGELENVLPLEDAALWKDAYRVKHGKIVPDPEKTKKRREAVVRNALARGPVGVIVLGGSHDLTELLPRDAQYIRIFVKSCPK